MSSVRVVISLKYSRKIFVVEEHSHTGQRVKRDNDIGLDGSVGIYQRVDYYKAPVISDDSETYDGV